MNASNGIKCSNPRLLVVCRSLFVEARRLSQLANDLAITKATIFLDLAVEQLLNLLIYDFDRESELAREDVSWNKLWDLASKAVKNSNLMSRLPNRRQLKTLRELRNLLQHRGTTPHATNISQAVSHVKQFLTDCFFECYELHFEKFRLIDVIKNVSLQRLIRESEDALAQNKAAVCIAGCKIAFEKIVNAISREITSDIERFASSTNFDFDVGGFATAMIFNQQFSEFMQEYSNKISDAIRTVRDDSEVANLGISMAETRRFRVITSTVSVVMSLADEWAMSELHGFPDENSSEFAEIALNYVTELTLLAEETHSFGVKQINIQKPLSEQGWY